MSFALAVITLIIILPTNWAGGDAIVCQGNTCILTDDEDVVRVGVHPLRCAACALRPL